jgi:hypothetical protein
MKALCYHCCKFVGVFKSIIILLFGIHNETHTCYYSFKPLRSAVDHITHETRGKDCMGYAGQSLTTTELPGATACRGIYHSTNCVKMTPHNIGGFTGAMRQTYEGIIIDSDDLGWFVVMICCREFEHSAIFLELSVANALVTRLGTRVRRATVCRIEETVSFLQYVYCTIYVSNTLLL